MDWEYKKEKCSYGWIEFFILRTEEITFCLDKESENNYIFWSNNQIVKQVNGIEEAEKLVVNELISRMLELDKRVENIKQFLRDC